MKTESNAKSNFGVTGWYYIILTAIWYYFATGLATDGLNVTVAKFSEVNGWSQAQLLNYSSIAGYIGIATTPFIASFMNRVGTRISATCLLLVSAIATVWWGMTTTPTQYLIACAIVTAAINGYAHLGATNLANNWFPKKKGLFLGWSTMGIQLSSVFFVAMMSFLMTKGGLQGAFWVVGICQLILAVLTWFTVKDTPQLAGKYPDNIPMSKEEMDRYVKEGEDYVSKWTYKDILANREVWLIGIGFGLLYMASIGLLSQWVPRLMSLGYKENKAILMLSIAAAIGLFGSYAWGWLDIKLGPKKASVGIMLDYVVALILTILPFSTVTLYLSMFLIGMGIGGVANLQGSLAGTIWGPYEYAKIFGVINTIESVVRITAFSIVAFGLTHLGGYNGAYSIFLGLCIIGVVLMALVREDYQSGPKRA